MKNTLAFVLAPFQLWKVVSVSILFALVLILTTAPQAALALRVQPELLAQTSRNPNQQVNVIVQKRSHDGSIERVISDIGGTVTQDLHIINAVAAQLPASSIPVLAQSGGGALDLA